MNQNISLTDQGDYGLQLQQLQRQQRLADQLQQQSIEPVQVAPNTQMSWTQGIAKMLQAYAGKRQSDKITERYNQLGAQDKASADALVRGLIGPQQLGTDSIAPQTSQISSAAPQLPGQPAPTMAPATAQVQVPGTQGTGMTNAAPSMQQQMAMLLAVGGGPQTQAVRGAMLPQIMQRQNMDYQRDQNWQDKLKERDLPLSVAAQQTMDAQGKQARDLAQFKNTLGPSPDAKLQYDLGMQKLRAANDSGLTEDGTFTPRVQSFGQNVISGNMTFQSVPAKDKPAVSMYLTQQSAHSPLAGTRLTLESDRITKPYRDMPGYALFAGAPVYADRIDAALKNPGSVGDQDALDALTKLNTGGNAVTDAQVHLITGNRSVSDWFGVMAGKLRNGGALSPDQRQQVKKVSDEIIKNYAKSYQPIFEKASAQLTEAKIPKQFWTMPDLNDLAKRRTELDAVGDKSQSDAALAWANANPKDPRAAAIKAKLGVK